MKSNEETCLLPGHTGPAAWRAAGKAGLQHVEVSRLKRADWVGLPQRMVTSLPTRFPAMDGARRDAAAQLELEGLGLTGLDEGDFQVVTHDDEQQRDQRAIIAVQTTQVPVPPEAGLESKFAPSVAFRSLAANNVNLWQEQGQWCMGIADEKGHPLHAQALTSRHVDGDAAAEIRCVLSALDLLGLTPEIREVVVEVPPSDVPRTVVTEEFRAELPFPVVEQPPLPPRLPKEDWRLTPDVITERRKQQRQRQTMLLAGVGALLVLVALLGAFSARLWTRERAIAAETARLDGLEPELATIRDAQQRWLVIESALTPDKAPAEIFHQIVQMLPEKGIRISNFQIEGSNVILSGEAQDPSLEGLLRQNLLDSKTPAFDGLQWDTPNSQPQASGLFSFDWQASAPATDESSGEASF
jgi:hypothetical protein